MIGPHALRTMIRPVEGEMRRLGQGQEVLGVATAHASGVLRLIETLGGELADRLQHPEALARVADQALLDERLERVEVGGRDLFRRLQRAAAGEDGEPREEPLLALPSSRSCDHSIVARSVCCRASASRPPLSRSSRSASRLQDLRRREHGRSRSGELDGEREIVEPAAQLRAISSSGSSCDRAQNSSTASCSASGGTGYSTSPWTRSSSRLVTSRCRLGHSARSDESSGAASTTCSRLSSRSSSSRSPMWLGEAVPSPRASARRSRRQSAGRGASRADPEHACLELGHELGRRLDREPRLAGSARPGQRHEPCAVPDERRPPPPPPARDRGRSSPAAGGSCSRSSSAAGSALSRAGRSPLRPSKSFSRCSPRSVTSTSTSVARRRRHEHLAAVAGRARSARRGARPRRRSPRPVRCGVPVCRPMRTTIGPRASSVCASSAAVTAPAAVGNAKKNASPCVSTSMPPWRVKAPRRTRRCCCERVRVRLRSELVQQPRRALDVREQERDRACRKVRSHCAQPSSRGTT